MQEQCNESGTYRTCRRDAHALHVQILRMSSSAAVNEALLSQLNVARTKVRRNSGGGGGAGSSGGGGTSSCNPLAAGSAAAVIIAACATDRAASCPVDFPGQQQPAAADTGELQQRIPSAASVDGTCMYGVFEDTAWTPTAGEAEKEADAVVMAVPPGSGGTGNGSMAPTYLNPFAAVAEQRQRQSQSDRLAAQGAADLQQRADDQDTPYDQPALRDSELNDSAIVCHGNFGAKGLDLVKEGSAAVAPLAASAPAAIKGAARKPSHMNDYYSAFRFVQLQMSAACQLASLACSAAYSYALVTLPLAEAYMHPLTTNCELLLQVTSQHRWRWVPGGRIFWGDRPHGPRCRPCKGEERPQKHVLVPRVAALSLLFHHLISKHYI